MCHPHAFLFCFLLFLFVFSLSDYVCENALDKDVVLKQMPDCQVQ